MSEKPWYESKLLWLGILQTVVGVSQAVIEFINTGNYSFEAVVVAVAGVLTFVWRKWFTNTTIA